jgi:glycosyltransferase involved in cell wall biosynthesis
MSLVVVKPLLSVIVPITNMAGRLHHLSSWITESSNKPIQIIIIHDIADQVTGIELKELLSKCKLSNIVLIEGKYGNPGYARNAGLKVATGEWCVFWDSDDRPMVNSILLVLMETNLDDEIIIGKFNVRNCLDGSVRQYYTQILSYKSVAMNPGIWRMIFRRQTISDTKFPSLRMGEDQVFLARLNFGTRKLRFVESIFYQYNLGGSSQLTKSRIAIKDLPLASAIILEHAKKAQRKQSIFDMQLFFRQQITVMKNGNFLLKLSIFKFIGKYFKKFIFTFLTESLIALIRVLRTIKSAGI